MPRVKKTEPEPEPELQSTPVKTLPKKEKKENKKQEDLNPMKEVDGNEVLVKTSVLPDQPVPVDVLNDASLTEEFTSILSQVQVLTQNLTGLKNSLRLLEKKTARELKQANKAKKKSKHAKANRQPSGFVKPTLISDELAAFLEKPKGSLLARTDVTKEINCYIREHKLQDPTNGRRIQADGKLKKLLNLTNEDELTYFNLQKYMSPHFAKAAPKPVVV